MSAETVEIERGESSAYAATFSEREWRRILRGRPYRVLVREDQIAYAGARAVRCITCRHAPGEMHDPWWAWCTATSTCVSNTFAKLCPRYERRA